MPEDGQIEVGMWSLLSALSLSPRAHVSRLYKGLELMSENIPLLEVNPWEDFNMASH